MDYAISILAAVGAVYLVGMLCHSASGLRKRQWSRGVALSYDERLREANRKSRREE